jgi:hypothetical protein
MHDIRQQVLKVQSPQKGHGEAPGENVFPVSIFGRRTGRLLFIAMRSKRMISCR